MSNDSNWYGQQAMLGQQNSARYYPATAQDIRNVALSQAKQRFKAIQEHIDAVPAMRLEQERLVSLIQELEQ
jgi:hypothetical protein